MKKLFTLMVVLLAFAFNVRAYDFFAYNSDGVKIYYEQPDYYKAEIKVTFGDDAYSGHCVYTALSDMKAEIN